MSRLLSGFIVIFLSSCIAAALKCGDQEVVADCAADCPSDYCPKSNKDNESCPKPKVCKSSCKCRFDYRRAKNGTCIPTRDCPPFKCHGPNEEFNSCPPSCPTDDCSQATPDGRCPIVGNILIVVPCKPSCRCIKGYWRKNGICVPYEQCNIKTSCDNDNNDDDDDDDGDNNDENDDCDTSSPSTPTTTLKPDTNSDCGNNKSCTGPNEEYVECKQTCPPQICNALVARYNCTNAPPCGPGCACKGGYLRANDTAPCMPICDCPQMKNSPDCQ